MADVLGQIPKIYLCFRNDGAGDNALGNIAALMPRSRIVYLPAEVGLGGGVSDFFVRLNKSREEFERLLTVAQPLVPAALRLNSDQHDG